MHFPPPATETEISAAEARIGFPLDEALRSFYSQMNGFTYAARSWTDEEEPLKSQLVAKFEAQKPLHSGPFSQTHFMAPNPTPDFWHVSEKARNYLPCVTHLSPIETLFHSSDTNPDAWEKADEHATISVRGTRFNKNDFYCHLYLFDAHHGYAPRISTPTRLIKHFMSSLETTMTPATRTILQSPLNNISSRFGTTLIQGTLVAKR